MVRLLSNHLISLLLEARPVILVASSRMVRALKRAVLLMVIGFAATNLSQVVGRAFGTSAIGVAPRENRSLKGNIASIVKGSTSGLTVILEVSMGMSIAAMGNGSLATRVPPERLSIEAGSAQEKVGDTAGIMQCTYLLSTTSAMYVVCSHGRRYVGKKEKNLMLHQFFHQQPTAAVATSKSVTAGASRLALNRTLLPVSVADL